MGDLAAPLAARPRPTVSPPPPAAPIPVSGGGLCPVYIDGRFLTQPLTGVQRYAEAIVGALDGLAGEGALVRPYRLLVPPGARDPGLRHIPVETIGAGGGHRWLQTHFYRAARHGVVLALGAAGPVRHRRQLVVIHDAAVYRHPEFYAWRYALAHRLLGKVLARRARIATVSAFSRMELAATLGLDAGAITVAPNGAEHLAIAADPTIRARLGLEGQPYFVTVSSFTPNKNLAVVARAFTRLGEGRARLVAVGAIDRHVFGTRGIPAATPDILLPGRLSDAEVAGLLQGARALIFPSFYEGFGIPPLEAMVNGCPVLASAIPAVAEVCGGAARYFPPGDDGALARLIHQVLDDPAAERARMIAAGHARAARFSWRASARHIAAACDGIADAP